MTATANKVLTRARPLRELINDAPDYELSAYPRAAWRRDVNDGVTSQGYGEIVQSILEDQMRETPLPEPLRPYIRRQGLKVSTEMAERLRYRFMVDGYAVFKLDFSLVFLVLDVAFENLVPFMVFRGSDCSVLVVRPDEAPSLDGRATGVRYELEYEWDGQALPDYTELKWNR